MDYFNLQLMVAVDSMLERFIGIGDGLQLTLSDYLLDSLLWFSNFLPKQTSVRNQEQRAKVS